MLLHCLLCEVLVSSSCSQKKRSENNTSCRGPILYTIHYFISVQTICKLLKLDILLDEERDTRGIISKQAMKRVEWEYSSGQGGNIKCTPITSHGWIMDIDCAVTSIQLLEYPIPARHPRPPLLSITKTVTWEYLGNREWYHRSAGVKMTGKKILK